MAAPTIDFASLPDNLILDILAYLPVKDRCISGRVCKRWHRIVQDNSLWRHVDLLPYVLSLNKLWKVMRAHFSECLLTMKLGGFCDPRSLKSKKHSLSNAMLIDLQERCPNLASLMLVKCNTDNLECKNLPTSLQYLSIQQCAWTPRWLSSSSDLDLIHLDLTQSTRVDNLDLSDIVCKFPNLKHLILNGCYRVSEAGLEKVVTTLTSLTQLELAETSCSDLTIHHASRNLCNLKILKISRCGQISQSSLATIATGLKELQVLDLSGSNQFKFDGLSQLAASISLKELILGGSSSALTEAELASLKESLGKDVFIHIHQPPSLDFLVPSCQAIK